MAWRTGTHENSNIEAGDLRVRNELRATHFPGSPSRTIWAPFPLLPSTLCKIIIFLAPLPPSPTPSACSVPGPEGWNPSAYLSCTHRPKPCFSTLPNFTSSRPPLGIQTWGRLTAPTPDTPGHARTLFLGKFSFLCAKACSTQATEPGGRLCGPDTK